MILKSVTVGAYQTNCYILKDEKTGKAAIIDPGYFSAKLQKAIEESGVTEFEYILLTHGHTDHICGVNAVKARYGGKIVIGEESEICLKEYRFIERVPSYEEQFKPTVADIYCSDNLTLQVGGIKITMLSTPGHMTGEYCFFTDNIVFTGDVLFNGAIGRTDLEGGNIFVLIKSLKKLLSCGDELIVMPGHGEPSTIADEKAHNRYIERIK